MTYRCFLQDVVSHLGAPNTDADRFSDETFHFEKHIAYTTPLPVDFLQVA
jgi:hypothetical protein